jgi:diguanylate cyclase (GGDEF)-like protein
MFGVPSSHPAVDRQWPFFTRVALPAIAAVFVLAGVLAAVMLLSAQQANHLAADRQQTLATTVLKQSMAQVAHDQEAVTVWDEAVEKVRSAQPDLPWLDANLGVWLHTYYNHDEAYIIDGSDHPTYAMRSGKRESPTDYQRTRPVVAPLIAKLRTELRTRPKIPLNEAERSPGVVDLAMIRNHPAIISVKPIISESGTPRQAPGREYVHVSVRYLNGNFAGAMTRKYQLDQASFATIAQSDDGYRSVPLRSGTGALLAYFSWRPFGPGALMTKQIMPYAVGALLLMLVTISLLLQRIRRSTLQLEASQAQAQHLAFHDALTGLANRALFDERLTRALAEAHQSSRSVALLYFDLDRFKHVNDTLGHPAGDQLICAMAKRLVAATRSSDVVARIGGDEFAIIQTGVTSVAEVEVLCMRIVEAVSEPYLLAGTKLNVGVSIGVALAPIDAHDRTELARKADIALYEAKAAGRGRYVFFAEQMDASIRHRREIERDLRVAIASGDEMRVVYQPLYSAQSGRITGAEALVRWQHPHKGLMSPATFIPIAESTGLIEPLGEWVLEEACRAALALPLNSISVNVSAVQLRNEKFAERVITILERTGLEPWRLELEITETSFIESAAHCQPNLAALRNRGVKIALDDFGTGYSSFSHLRCFDIDRIKIDQSFVNGIDVEAGGSAIIQAIVDLAKASGMQVTAEGVETAEQSTFLTEAGCNSLQGYLLSRPVGLGELTAMFTRLAVAT